MSETDNPRLIELDTAHSIWERFFTLFPLVVVGTREADGKDDLAPKHLAIPMSWKSRFGFVCTPRHNTYQNVVRNRQFTVTYMRPSQTVLASLAASPRCRPSPRKRSTRRCCATATFFSSASSTASSTTSTRIR